MKAASYNSFGPARDVLVVGELKKPLPGPGEVLVSLAASGVNPSDVKKRMGSSPDLLENGAVIPHSDGAGVIESWTMTWTSPIVRLADTVGGGLSNLLTGGKNLLTAHSRAAELEDELGEGPPEPVVDEESLFGEDEPEPEPDEPARSKLDRRTISYILLGSAGATLVI